MEFPKHYELGYETPVDFELQQQFDAIETRVRAKYDISCERAAAGVLDLKRFRLALLRPDQLYYAASVSKLGILLAYFHLNPEAGNHLDSNTRRELAQMVKSSSDQAATRFSRLLGLEQIQSVLNHYGFYQVSRGGGIWMGKHYGENGLRIVDPCGGHSHAATVRQLIRFYLLLDQGGLVSAPASRTMQGVFDFPEISNDEIKFVAGLAGRSVKILRKWGSWEDWLHDTAIITGPDRKFILVALTHHPCGDGYLAELARATDDLLTHSQSSSSASA